MRKPEIVKAIHYGLNTGYFTDQELKNNQESISVTITEYLLTVFVAIEMGKMGNIGPNSKVLLEHSLRDFYNEAFPDVRWENEDQLFAEFKLLEREFKAEESKKRIDIALLTREKESDQAKHGIELKGINKSNDLIEEDIRRLSDSMITNDKIGNNSIDSCYVGFIYSFNGSRTVIERIKELDNETKEESIRTEKKVVLQCTSQADHDEFVKKSKKKVIRILLNFKKNDMYENLSYSGSIRTIQEESEESISLFFNDLPIEEKLDTDEIAFRTGKVISVVVEISRKDASN